MSQFFDVRTLTIVMGAVVFALGFSMVYYGMVRETYRGFGAWTTGIVLVCIGFFVVALRHVLPDFITIILGNGLIVSGLALFYMGFQLIAEKRVKPFRHWIPVVVIALFILPFFTYIVPSVSARIAVVSFAGASYYLLCARVLFRDIHYDAIRLNGILGATLLLTTVMFLFRGVFSLLPGNAVSDFMAAGNLHGIIILGLIVLVVFFVTGLLHLNSQLLERDLVREQKQLKESEEKFRRLVDQSLQGLVIAQDNPVRLRFASKPMETITGYSREELENFGPAQLAALIHPDEREAFFRNFRDRLSGNPPPPMYETRLVHKTKGTRWVELYSTRIEHEGEPASHTIFLDITERKLAQRALRESEEKLARSRKMEALGLLAGGVAHDLNNILSGIVSYPELLLMDLPENSPLRKPIQTIQESGMRAADVVADLLTIARGAATGKEVFNLNRVVKEIQDFAEFTKLRERHPRVFFKVDLDPHLLNINGSSVHLKKSLMNLVTNAWEATEKSGTVTISTCNRYLDEPLKGYEDVRPGEYAVLRVSDEGSGISPEDMGRIFEPFYTRKVMGRSGTGLGLAVVWNTVQDHHGYIHVSSNEKGTVFELFFPVSREAPASAGTEIAWNGYRGHGEKILLVDDEARQREIGSALLEKLGYVSETVSSGEEAIRYVKEHSVDLIVLDMIMPGGLNGRETFQEIRKICPGQKAIIASGYARTEEVQSTQDSGAGEYVRKPYTLEKIGLAIQGALK